MGFKCPWGHQSTNDEYCDFCGALNPMARQVVRGPASRSASGVAVVEQPCRVCGTGRDGMDRYCVNCGYDFEVGEPLPPDLQAHWEALPSAPPINGQPELPAAAPSPTPSIGSPRFTPPVSTHGSAPAVCWLSTSASFTLTSLHGRDDLNLVAVAKERGVP